MLDAAAPPGDVAALEVLALVALAGGDEAVARGACAWLATAPGPLAATALAALAERGYASTLTPAEHREACDVAAAALAAPPSDAARRAVAAALAPAARRWRAPPTAARGGRGAGARPSSGVPALARRRLTGVAPQAGTVAVAVAAVAAGDEAGDVGVLIRSGLVVHAARDDDAAAAAAARRAAGARSRASRARTRPRGPPSTRRRPPRPGPRRCSPAAATTPSTRR